ncbi:hypothetical protein OKW29_002238 [Paraburkholderia sp. CI3]
MPAPIHPHNSFGAFPREGLLKKVQPLCQANPVNFYMHMLTVAWKARFLPRVSSPHIQAQCRFRHIAFRADEFEIASCTREMLINVPPARLADEAASNFTDNESNRRSFR